MKIICHILIAVVWWYWCFLFALTAGPALAKSGVWVLGFTCVMTAMASRQIGADAKKILDDMFR